jgi:hypothetical protein
MTFKQKKRVDASRVEGRRKYLSVFCFSIIYNESEIKCTIYFMVQTRLCLQFENRKHATRVINISL